MAPECPNCGSTAVEECGPDEEGETIWMECLDCGTEFNDEVGAL